MQSFYYCSDHLYCEETSIAKVAEKVGTPLYIYSRRALEEQYRAFDAAFSGVDHLVCYAVKANSNLALLNLFAGMGSGFDVVSGGELYRALRAGATGQRLIYAGVGKTAAEIDYALQANILFFSVESEAELEVIAARARALKRIARISLRVNPNVDARTHPYISTGLQKHKFGINLPHALKLYHRARSIKGVRIVGVSCHIGSQITSIEPFVAAVSKIRRLVERLKSEGIPLRYLDLGGGLGITYRDETPPALGEYAAALISGARGLDCTLVFEPGRVIVGNAGILVTQILYSKTNTSKKFIIVDAGMNDLIRPSLYGSFHEIWPIQRRTGPKITADVVGPVCESADFLAKDRRLQKPLAGDLLSVMSSGAYGFALASNYNSRPRPPEVLVDGRTIQIIRTRETYADLIRGEQLMTEA
ncbi:MAG: diaminopimelate decarboxylase [Acidobacteria bacterium]|nr:diaminopimelate decarboxylase [Acidobacteriota bacterium]MBI3657764.1 diaminopimelate decarboxylase [Acidobacteriota bacterium]